MNQHNTGNSLESELGNLVTVFVWISYGLAPVTCAGPSRSDQYPIKIERRRARFFRLLVFPFWGNRSA